MSGGPSAAMDGRDTPPQKPRRRGLPLAPQIVVLLLGGLVIAQLTTLCLTLALPPEPQSKYPLSDVASALRGGALATGMPRPLVRTVRTEPPSSQSPGWLVSEQSRDDLARLTGANPADVRLLYYSPLPFAGATGRKDETPPRAGGQLLYAGSIATLAMLLPAPAAGGAPGGGFPGRGADGGMAGGGMAGGMGGGAGPAGGFPTTGAPGGGQGRLPGGGFPGGGGSGWSGASMPAGSIPIGGGPFTTSARGGSPFSAILTPPASQPTSVQATLPPAQTTGYAGQQGAGAVARPWAFTPGAPVMARAPLPLFQAPAADVVLPHSPIRRELTSYRVPVSADASAAPVARTAERLVLNAAAAATTGQPAPSVVVPAGPAPAQARAPQSAGEAGGYALPSEKDQGHGLFGAAATPFVSSDFVAALRVGPNRWVVVQPRPEPFPNSWQRRIILWFLLSSAVVAPIGILFARRLAAPLGAFAEAAESLGRDPRATPTPIISGPAEIGRAAAALNQMQIRLRRFIEDRTAMVGAISHDLRTPLARMRFRLERAPEEIRAGMLSDIGQMEEMISGVLAFIRDASEVTTRERIELRSLLECVVDNAALMGGDVVLDPGGRVPVDIDCLSVERVLTNLVDNALKYGDRARVRVFEDGADIVAEVEDDGPGLPAEELERVFAPFYRSDHSRNLNRGGIGLGLAVSRSIARAHGGDVSLSRGERGLRAQLRLPKAQAA